MVKCKFPDFPSVWLHVIGFLCNLEHACVEDLLFVNKISLVSQATRKGVSYAFERLTLGQDFLENCTINKNRKEHSYDSLDHKGQCGYLRLRRSLVALLSRYGGRLKHLRLYSWQNLDSGFFTSLKDETSFPDVKEILVERCAIEKEGVDTLSKLFPNARVCAVDCWLLSKPSPKHSPVEVVKIQLYAFRSQTSQGVEKAYEFVATKNRRFDVKSFSKRLHIFHPVLFKFERARISKPKPRTAEMEQIERRRTLSVEFFNGETKIGCYLWTLERDQNTDCYLAESVLPYSALSVAFNLTLNGFIEI